MLCSFALLLKASECLSITGGFSEVQAATEYIQKIADEVKCRVQKRYKDRKMYKAIEFEEQVVAGTNYRIKLQLDDDEFVTIKVFKPLMGGQAKFMGFMRSRNNPHNPKKMPIWIPKPPKVEKLPLSNMFTPYDNFSEDKKPNKKVQMMLEQFKDEIFKDLDLHESYKGHVFEADEYRTQKAENGIFYEISFWENSYDYSKALIYKGKGGKLEFRRAYGYMSI